MTYTSAVSHQVVACITTVGGCLSEGYSSSVTNLAIGWVSQSTTVHVCEKKESSSKSNTVTGITLSTYLLVPCKFYILLTTTPGTVVLHTTTVPHRDKIQYLATGVTELNHALLSMEQADISNMPFLSL